MAVLEEEVVRLEEQLVNFRQGLYQEAVYISSSKSSEDSTPSLIKTSKQKHSRSLSQNEPNLVSLVARAPPALSRTASSRKFLSFSGASNSSEKLTSGRQPQNEQSLAVENGSGKENRSSTPIFDRSKTNQEKKSSDMRTPSKIHPQKPGSIAKSLTPVKTEVLQIFALRKPKFTWKKN